MVSCAAGGIPVDSTKEDALFRLENAAKTLGMEAVRDWKISGGEIDLVWFLKTKKKIGDMFGCRGPRIPVIAFCIQNGRADKRKIKRDMFNLMMLSPTCGVVLLLDSGKGGGGKDAKLVGEVKKFAEDVSDVCNIAVWTGQDMEKMLGLLSAGK